MSNPAYFFLNLDFGSTLSGIEKSALLRARLFVDYLGISPTIVTSKFQPRLLENWARYTAAEQVPASVTLQNPYLYYQETLLGQNLAPYDFLSNCTLPRESFRTTKGEWHVKVYDQVQQLQHYAVYTPQQQLRYINHFAAGKKVSRDHFNSFGQLSHSDTLGPTGEKLATTFFHVTGIRVLTRTAQDTFFLYDKSGVCSQTFSTEADFLRYFLSCITAATPSICIIDKNRVYAPLFSDGAPPNTHVIPIIHNSHLALNRDLVGTKINRNYAAVFAHPEVFSAIVTLTNAQKKAILETMSLPQLHAIGHCIPAPSEVATTPTMKGVKPYSIAYVGRLAKEKRIEDCIKAVAHLIPQYPTIQLDIYGSGSEQPRLESLVDDYQLHSNVHFHGYIDDVARVYAEHEVSITASNFEAFSLTIVESLAAGCPVVCYDVPYGAQELIQSGENGWRVPFQEYQALSTCLANYFKLSTAERQAFRGQAQKSSQSYTESRIAEKWQVLLAKLTKKKTIS